MDFLYKVCKKCEIEKNLEEFHKDIRNIDGREGSCKECKKKYQQENKARIKENKSIYYNNNKEKFKEYRNNNKEKFKEYNDKYVSKLGKNFINYRKRENYKNMTQEEKENLKKMTQNWIKLNKEKHNLSKREYQRKRKKEDLIFKIATQLRSSIGNHLIKKNFSKNKKTEEIIGCSFEEFKIFIESKFESWMTWENHGLYNGEFNYGWDLDHIIPVSSAKTEEELLILNHYTNFQPLCSKVNRFIKRNY